MLVQCKEMMSLNACFNCFNREVQLESERREAEETNQRYKVAQRTNAALLQTVKVTSKQYI
jgi:hypothetical protein